MNKSIGIAIICLVCTSMIASCSKKVKEQPDTTSQQTSSADTSPPPMTSNLYTSADLNKDPCLRQRVVYFDFDQDTVKPEYQSVISCHAKYLHDRSSARMTLQGNTDERGSRAYNQALGERRANSISQAMQAAGASPNQLTVISYGEERPTCSESNDHCWSQNRRVEIVYNAQ